MNKSTPKARFVRGFLIAIGPTLVWAAKLDYAHLSSDQALQLALGIVVALIAGGLAALLAWREILQGGGVLARAGAQALEQFVAGVSVLVLVDLSGPAVIVYVTAVVSIIGQSVAGGLLALVLNLTEGTDPPPPEPVQP